ncbi:hypothetical protein KC354_g37 [Hortaea werneckii]|nr:hypothetical protein KC354_g37 [Hortaea werneckii]
MWLSRVCLYIPECDDGTTRLITADKVISHFELDTLRGRRVAVIVVLGDDSRLLPVLKAHFMELATHEFNVLIHIDDLARTFSSNDIGLIILLLVVDGFGSCIAAIVLALCVFPNRLEGMAGDGGHLLPLRLCR